MHQVKCNFARDRTDTHAVKHTAQHRARRLVPATSRDLSSPFRVRRAHAIIGVAILALVSVLHGCDKANSDAGPSPLTQLKLNIATSMTTGIELDTCTINAARFDQITQALHDVVIEGPDGLVRAKVARMRVDLLNETLSLELEDVWVAQPAMAADHPDRDAPGVSPEGGMFHYDTMVIGPVSISDYVD